MENNSDAQSHSPQSAMGKSRDKSSSGLILSKHQLGEHNGLKGASEQQMEITKTLYLTNRKDWRAWLKKHYQTEKEIWLVYPKKASGKPRIEYDDAVEEALCFGWIDSLIKKLDEE